MLPIHPKPSAYTPPTQYGYLSSVCHTHNMTSALYGRATLYIILLWNFADEYQQFDVLVGPVKQAVRPRLVTWFNLLISDTEQKRIEQNLALYFSSCVLNCCGLPLLAPKSLDALQLGLAAERISKLRRDFESYLDRANTDSSTNHEVFWLAAKHYWSIWS